jgi:hypothetical protein
VISRPPFGEASFFAARFAIAIDGRRLGLDTLAGTDGGFPDRFACRKPAAVGQAALPDPRANHPGSVPGGLRD